MIQDRGPVRPSCSRGKPTGPRAVGTGYPLAQGEWPPCRGRIAGGATVGCDDAGARVRFDVDAVILDGTAHPVACPLPPPALPPGTKPLAARLKKPSHFREAGARSPDHGPGDRSPVGSESLWNHASAW